MQCANSEDVYLADCVLVANVYSMDCARNWVASDFVCKLYIRAIVDWVFIFWMFLFFPHEKVLIYLLCCINSPDISSLTQTHEWLLCLDAQWLRCLCLAALHVWLFLSCLELVDAEL